MWMMLFAKRCRMRDHSEEGGGGVGGEGGI